MSTSFKLSNKRLTVKLTTSFSGTVAQAPPIVFTIENRNMFTEFTSLSSLIFLVGEDRISSSEGVYRATGAGLGMKETISHVLLNQDFKKILDSKSVEARIGQVEFTLDDKHLKSMREFYSAIPVAKENK